MIFLKNPFPKIRVKLFQHFSRQSCLYMTPDSIVNVHGRFVLNVAEIDDSPWLDLQLNLRDVAPTERSAHAGQPVTVGSVEDPTSTSAGSRWAWKLLGVFQVWR